MTNEAVIEVVMTWDEDPSVGIYGHWDECAAIVQVGTIATVFGFDPDEKEPVDTWRLVDISVRAHTRETLRWPVPEAAARGVKMSHWPHYTIASLEEEPTVSARVGDFDEWRYERRPMLLGDFPEVAEAVETHWRRLLAEQEAAEEAYAEAYEEQRQWEAEHGDPDWA